jgi:hypothetical protein
MRLAGRLAPLLCVTAGCGFAQKPYADDPLLRGGRAVWATREPSGVESTPPPASPVPEPPRPPDVATSPRWE